jgi:hypothetical protein
LSRSPLRRAAVSFSTAQILMVSLVTFPHPIFYIFSSSLIQQMVTDSELRWCKLTLVFIKLTTAQTEPSSPCLLLIFEENKDIFPEKKDNASRPMQIIKDEMNKCVELFFKTEVVYVHCSWNEN